MLLGTKIYTQARMMATDQDLCRIFNLTPEALELHRATIERGRAEALVELRHERARQTARRGAARKADV